MINNNWLLGFIEAEGTISYNKRLKKPEFIITQHIADYKLMEKIFFAPALRGLKIEFEPPTSWGAKIIFFDSKKIIFGLQAGQKSVHT